MGRNTRHRGGRASIHHDLVGEAGKKFEEVAKRSPTFVRYHMTHCGHCIAMKGEWDKLVKDVEKDKKMNVELVNLEQSALEHVPDHLKKDIVGFPTLVSYGKGGVNREEYQGERKADSMKEWLKGRSSQSGGRRSRRRHSRGSCRSHSRAGRRHTRRHHSSRRVSRRR